MVSTTYLLSALRWNQKRMEKPRDIDKMDLDNIVIGCGQINSQACRSMRDWLSRDNRLRIMQNRRLTKVKERAINDLLTFTISSVEACNWLDDWTLGCLPTRSEPATVTRVLSEAQKAALATGRVSRKAADDEAFQRRLEARLRSGDHPVAPLDESQF